MKKLILVIIVFTLSHQYTYCQELAISKLTLEEKKLYLSELKESIFKGMSVNEDILQLQSVQSYYFSDSLELAFEHDLLEFFTYVMHFNSKETVSHYRAYFHEHFILLDYFKSTEIIQNRVYKLLIIMQLDGKEYDSKVISILDQMKSNGFVSTISYGNYIKNERAIDLTRYLLELENRTKPDELNSYKHRVMSNYGKYSFKTALQKKDK